MAYCFRHSIIGAPNMSKLDRAYRLGKSFFSPEDVLELIEQCHIQVIAREKWYDKIERLRPNAFQSSDWLDGIDSRLRDYAIADEHKPTTEKRVIIAPDEKGNAFSEQIMGSHRKRRYRIS